MGAMNHAVSGVFDPGLVVLSYLVASLAAYTALDLGARVNAASGWSRRGWIVGGACAMGLGIWSMHFIGMLAFQMPMPVVYDLGTVIWSFVFAVAAAAVALVVVARPSVSFMALSIAGVLMGSGIVAVHYTGMAAMRMAASIEYDPWLVLASVLIAVVASMVAMSLTFYFRSSTGRKGLVLKVNAGFVMGAAIAGMHYTGMVAARFYDHPGVAPAIAEGLDAGPLGILLGSMTVLILFVALLGAFAERRIWFHADQSRISQTHYKALFENNGDAIFSLSREGRILSVNPAGGVLTGWSSESLLGMHYRTLLWDSATIHDGDYEGLVSGASRAFELPLRHRDQKRLLFQVTSVPMEDSQGSPGVFFIGRDITQQRDSEERIHQLAYFDPLTALPNRVQLLQTMERVAAEGGKVAHPWALVMMDIEHFKLINSSMGQEKGNRVLKLLSERLLRDAPPGSLTARVGSDEFALFLPRITSRDAVRVGVEGLLVGLQQPYPLDERNVHLSLRMGYAVMPSSVQGSEALLKAADTALHHSKGPQRARIQAFEPGLLLEDQRRVDVEAGLRRALDRGELEVHYQPQFDFDRRPIGAEALVRWRHPERGLISPAEFIPVAEATGLIGPIGEWVLKTACEEWSRWRIPDRPDMRLAVNLSTRQFEDPTLVKRVSSVLALCDFPASSLELEITESMAMDVDHTLQALKDLKALGLRISMDDFGTGYSSLSYLQHFPIDQLKIDQSFVREIGRGDSGAIVETIIDLGHHLKVDVLAEGVETEEQLEFLRLRGCDLVQGYLLSRPLVGEQIRELFEKA